MDGSHSLLIRSQQFGTQMPQGGHPPHHSITSSASASNLSGTSSPSALAVLRLIARCNGYTKIEPTLGEALMTKTLTALMAAATLASATSAVPTTAQERCVGCGIGGP